MHGGAEYCHPITSIASTVHIIAIPSMLAQVRDSTAAPAAHLATADGASRPDAMGRLEPLTRSSWISITPFRR
jgi:hypothetical protein